MCDHGAEDLPPLADHPEDRVHEPNQQARVTALCAGLGIAATATAVALGARGPWPVLLPLLTLAVLHAFSESQIAIPHDQLASSAGVMLCMGAMVVFRDSESYLGPMLVGAAGCLNIPHLMGWEWRKLLFNASMFAFAALAGTSVLWFIVGSGHAPPAELLLASLPAALAYAVVNLVLVALVIALATGQRLLAMIGLVSKEYLIYLPFAFLGVFLGELYLEYGVVLVPLFVVPILVARQAYSAYLAEKEQHEATVRILIGALEAKDPYTAGHAERVATYVHYIGIELGVPASRLERLRLAALMHDVGKLVVPNHLLNKPGKLTAEEFTQVRRHEEVSFEILTRIDFLAPVARSATTKAGEFAPVADERDQPIEPHIVAVADAYDAMTSTRSYRKALTQEIAFTELQQNAGKQFDPRVVDALISALRRRGEVHGRGHEAAVHHEDAPEAGTGSAGLGDLMPDTDGSKVAR
ncbi:MAG: HD domain-containing protein [Actinobacteria bacterium]|nr:HD domain-containing protein [Actinomycetota bacterium]